MYLKPSIACALLVGICCKNWGNCSRMIHLCRSEIIM